MNLKQISIEEARALPSGSELWVGQTRQTARVARRIGYVAFAFDDTLGWPIDGQAHGDFNLKFFLPTREAVPIEPDEAAARMVRGEPVEACIANDATWFRPTTSDLGAPVKRFYRIPALPEPTQRLTIEMSAEDAANLPVGHITQVRIFDKQADEGAYYREAVVVGVEGE